MIICGTYGSKKRSCNNCHHFMLWGVTYGYCIKHKEDFPAQHTCKGFKKFTIEPWKQIFMNNNIYDIECFHNDDKKTVFLVHSNAEELTTIGGYYTLRDAMNAIKKDAFK